MVIWGEPQTNIKGEAFACFSPKAPPLCHLSIHTNTPQLDVLLFTKSSRIPSPFTVILPSTPFLGWLFRKGISPHGTLRLHCLRALHHFYCYRLSHTFSFACKVSVPPLPSKWIFYFLQSYPTCYVRLMFKLKPVTSWWLGCTELQYPTLSSVTVCVCVCIYISRIGFWVSW